MCSGCGETLICIGDIWYGPHTASNCRKTNADALSEVEDCDESLSGCIEVKQEEIVDIDDEDGLSNYNGEEISIHDEGSGIFGYEPAEDDTKSETGNEQTNEEQYQIENILNQNELTTDGETKTESMSKCFKIVNQKYKVDLSNCKMTPIHHKNKCIGFKSEPHGTKSMETPHKRKLIRSTQTQEIVVTEENVGSFVEMQLVGGEMVAPGLTKDQLDRRQCPICLKVIINRQNLICHMNIHNDVKPFVCTICHKSFAHIRNLNRHKEQQKHSEYIFKCIVHGCKQTFISSKKMHRHVKISHRIQTTVFQGFLHECQYCQKAFSSIGYLRMHMRKKHQHVQ